MTEVISRTKLVLLSKLAKRREWLGLAGCLFALSMTPSFSSAQDANAAAKQPTVGSKVTDFDLPLVDSIGELKLSDAYSEGPVVVVVLRGYPGYQCPVCSRQVGTIITKAKKFAEVTSKVILVYPGPKNRLVQRANEFIAGRDLPEPIVMVRDADMKMVSSWGLRWDASGETAYPSTFVIDKTGNVTWAKISESHAGRSSVTEVIAALKKL